MPQMGGIEAAKAITQILRNKLKIKIEDRPTIISSQNLTSNLTKKKD